MISLPVMKHQKQKEEIHYRKIKDMNIKNFKDDFKELNADISSDINFELSYKKFNSSSEKLIDKHAPVTKRKVINQPNVPWIDTEFKRCRSLRRKYERIWKKNKTEGNRERYVVQRKLCAEMSIFKQREYYSKLVDASSDRQRSLFKMVDTTLTSKSYLSIGISK